MQNTFFPKKPLTSNKPTIMTETKTSGLLDCLFIKNQVVFDTGKGGLHRYTILNSVLKGFENLFLSIFMCEVFHSILQEVKST
jgi:hypothetical protein